jgi:hypothetical protein
VTRRRHSATEPARDSEPRPQTIIDWLVWLALWPVVTVAWLVAVPFILLYAYSDENEQPFRSIVNTDSGIVNTHSGDRERSEATLGV